jgi:hypothetical protein
MGNGRVQRYERSRTTRTTSANAHCADEARPPYVAKTWRGDYSREKLLFSRRNFSLAVDQVRRRKQRKIGAALFFIAELGRS